MSNEEHHHLELENSQYQNQSHPVYQKFVLTKPSDIDKSKSKIEASVSETLAYVTEVVKGKYD